MAVTEVVWAREAAVKLLAPLRSRLDHVTKVAELANAVARAVPERSDVLVAAAWAHDIGYASELVETGFHPLDGARFIALSGHYELASLVAHHSGARNEARLRGLEGALAEFPFADSVLDRALTYCDLTTGPDGSRMTLDERISEIQQRYGPEHVVSQAMCIGRPEFERARDEIERLMAEAGIELTGSLAYPRTDNQ